MFIQVPLASRLILDYYRVLSFMCHFVSVLSPNSHGMWNMPAISFVEPPEKPGFLKKSIIF